jgi:5'-nucleotidase
VLSGVNAGSNVADDVTYSGTIAGAIEGTMQGVRSFALSQAYLHEDGARGYVPWDVSRRMRRHCSKKLIGLDLPEGTFLNLNFPNCRPDEVEGVEVTAQGKLAFNLQVDARADGRGFPTTGCGSASVPAPSSRAPISTPSNIARFR